MSKGERLRSRWRGWWRWLNAERTRSSRPRSGRTKQSEAELSESLLTHLDQSMLLIADRGFFSYALWRKAVQSGADLLWRARTDRGAPTPRHVKDLPDGSWLADLRQTHSASKLVAPIRSGFGSSTTRSMTDVNTPTPTACSPPSSIPTKPARSSWPLRTGVAGDRSRLR